MEIEQSYISWILGFLNLCFVGVIKFILGENHDIRQEHNNLKDRVAKIEILVAGEYMKRGEVVSFFDKVDGKLDIITEKLNNKVDK